MRLMGRLSALSAPSPSLWVQLRQCSPSNIEMPPSVPNHTRCCASTATPYTHSLTSSFFYVVNWPALSRRFAPAQVPLHIVPPGCSAKAYFLLLVWSCLGLFVFLCFLCFCVFSLSL